MRNSKTGQECNTAESRAGRLGGAGKTDSFLCLSSSLFMSPSPCVCLSCCLTFCLCLSHLSTPISLNSLFFVALSLSVCLSLSLPCYFRSHSCLSVCLRFHLVRACLEFNSVVHVRVVSRCLAGGGAIKSLQPVLLSFRCIVLFGLCWLSTGHLWPCVAFMVWSKSRQVTPLSSHLGKR